MEQFFGATNLRSIKQFQISHSHKTNTVWRRYDIVLCTEWGDRQSITAAPNRLTVTDLTDCYNLPVLQLAPLYPVDVQTKP